MPLARTAELMSAAYRAGEAICAFNVTTLESAEGIVAGAATAGSAVILQISQNALAYRGSQVSPITSAVVAIARESPVPTSVHLDHIEDRALLTAGAAAGVSSAMFDASKLAYRENVAATKAVAEWAHEHELFLEAELGEIGGKDGAHAPWVRTDPDDAAGFVSETGVDALAVAVGSSHAMSTRTAALDFDLIARLRAGLPVPLVLHGSSGVPNEDLRRATQAGITKVNVGTLLNAAFTDAVRSQLADNSAVVDPRRYLAPARDAVADVVAATIRALA